MITCNPKTEGDYFVSNYISRLSPSDIAKDIVNSLQDKRRSVPYGNANVVATVAYMAINAAEFKRCNTPQCDIVCKTAYKAISNFSTGSMNWASLVSFAHDFHRRQKISDDVFDAIIDHLESMADDIMDATDKKGVPGDHHISNMRIIRNAMRG